MTELLTGEIWRIAGAPVPAKAAARVPWSDAETATLKGLWAGGVSNAQIAKQLGRTSQMVLNKAIRLGLPQRNGKLPVAREAPTQEPEPVILSTDHLCHLWELENNSCRYPCWSGEQPASEQFFCGIPEADMRERRPYCSGHMALAYLRHPSMPNEAAP